ncbi:hypothetical protein [Evansella tamaricis]|uniref:Histone deacetylase n=1 Tax=Evansella tamaricis TaxID=2069301 RepID=A0ABS6JHI0_9BACI|nr:hypothetical protein [Evansella tamaricis]MBU9713132.1 hypothetical protein [Evansella tamaricis]
MKANNYVWYASYGSNMNKQRFLCYIQGGTPKGSDKAETGCRDHSLPVDEKAYVMNYQMVFAKKSKRWQDQGVAFIGLKKDEDIRTYSNMYLITEEQFIDVVSQENHGIEDLILNLGEVRQLGSKVFRDSWYGNIVYLGEDAGYPIFTFTHPEELEYVEIRKPSPAYLKTIINGLKNDLDLSDGEIFTYISKLPGIKQNMTIDEIETIIKDS